MTDEPRDAAPNEPADDSASAIFAAIMREAAAKTRPSPASPGRSADDPADDAAPQPDSNAESKPAPSKPRPRIQRVAAAQAPRQPGQPGAIGGFFRTLFIVCLSAALVATLLTWFTNPAFISPAVVQGLQADAMLLANLDSPRQTPTPMATPKWHYRIGIISGHRGRDSGAVCEDRWGNAELIERDINFAVAQRVVTTLKADNYSVDLLDENDPRLDDYRATALVSIHANTCQDFGEFVSGYIVSKADSRPDHGADVLLRECVALNYGAYVPLKRSFVETADMTDYHNFRIIHPLTPAVILEMGYMLADREILTSQSELLAHAVTQGVRCFLAESGVEPALSESSGDPGYLAPIIATPTPAGRGF